MSSLHFLVHPLPGSDEQLAERLLELGDQINKNGLNSPSVLAALQGGPSVLQIAVGPAHIALLFDHGRVARLPFSVIPDRLDLSKNDSSKSVSKTFDSGSARQRVSSSGGGQQSSMGQRGLGSGSNPANLNQSSPIWLSDEMEYWPDRSLKFVSIAAMHSELVAFGANGTLYQWKWVQVEPYKHPESATIFHPRALSLGLASEKVVCLSASSIRCSVATDSGKVATWLDESIAHVAAASLEHSAQAVCRWNRDKVVQLLTCSLYTLARTESDDLFWWGVLPFNQRKERWNNTCHYRTTLAAAPANEITTGSHVCCFLPSYQAGSIAITVSGGIPKVGQLLNSAWNLSETCRFKVIPSSSQNKRAKKNLNIRDGAEENDEEDWMLEDVIFVEDSESFQIGRVLEIDGAYAVVKFKKIGTREPRSIDDAPTAPTEDMTSMFQDCRRLHLDKLHLVQNAVVPEKSFCIQKLPQWLRLENLNLYNILSLSVDAVGIHVIVRDGPPGARNIWFKSYDLCSGEVECESAFPTEAGALLEVVPALISLNCGGGEGEVKNVLRDGMHPVVKACVEAIKDPLLLDMPPVRCLGLGIHALPHVGASQKNQVGVLVLVLETQLLMDKILKCDVEGVRSVVGSLDSDLENKTAVNKVLLERCDGNRNVFHAGVMMAMPKSSKEVEAVRTSQSSSPPNVLRTSSEGTGSSSSCVCERVRIALAALKIMCESVALEPHLHQLLAEKDAKGQTPFMLAVSSRAYPAALLIFETIQKIFKERPGGNAEVQMKMVMYMIYPEGSSPDDSPLDVLCCNDTCSFTWTSAECKCNNALVMGNESARNELLAKLVAQYETSGTMGGASYLRKPAADDNGHFEKDLMMAKQLEKESGLIAPEMLKDEPTPCKDPLSVSTDTPPLPPEMHLNIFKWLSVPDLLSCSLVQKSCWNTAARDILKKERECYIKIKLNPGDIHALNWAMATSNLTDWTNGLEVHLLPESEARIPLPRITTPLFLPTTGCLKYLTLQLGRERGEDETLLLQNIISSASHSIEKLDIEEYVLSFITDCDQKFPKLKVLHVHERTGYPDDPDCYSVVEKFILKCAPNIQEVTGCWWSAPTVDEHPVDPKVISKVKSLDFPHFYASVPESFADLSGLARLHLVNFDNGFLPEAIQFSIMLKSLKTLVELRIEAQALYNFITKAQGEVKFPNLSELWLHVDSRTQLRTELAVWTEWRKRCPRLEEVFLRFHGLSDEEDHEDEAVEEAYIPLPSCCSGDDEKSLIPLKISLDSHCTPFDRYSQQYFELLSKVHGGVSQVEIFDLNGVYYLSLDATLCGIDLEEAKLLVGGLAAAGRRDEAWDIPSIVPIRPSLFNAKNLTEVKVHFRGGEESFGSKPRVSQSWNVEITENLPVRHVRHVKVTCEGKEEFLRKLNGLPVFTALLRAQSHSNQAPLG